MKKYIKTIHESQMLRWAMLLVLLVMSVLIPYTSIFGGNSNIAEASSVTDPGKCLERAGKYKNISSVQNACNACSREPSINHGAAWLSNAKGGREAVSTFTFTGKNGKTLDELKKDKTLTVKTKIYGMAYSCNHSNPKDRQIGAYYVWFGPRNTDGRGVSMGGIQQFVNNNAYKFITVANATPGSRASSYKRGLATGNKGTWSSLDTGGTAVKVNLSGFLEKAKCTTTVEEQFGESSGSKIATNTCTLDVSVNRCFNTASMVGSGKEYYTPPGSGINPGQGNGCGGEDSTIVLVLTTKPADEGCTSDTPYSEADKNCFCKFHPDDKRCVAKITGEISTTSKVKVAEQGEKYHDIREDEVESPKNGTATIKMSTKEEEVEVEFEHHLNYMSSVNKDAFAASEGLYPEQLTTGYGVTKSKTGPNPSYARTEEEKKESEKKVNEFGVPISICQSTDEDEPDDSCPSLIYNSKLFPFAGKLGTDLEKDSRSFSSGGEVPPDGDPQRMTVDDKGNPTVITKVKIKTKPGEKVKVCQKIKGKPKRYIYTGTMYDAEVLKDGSYVKAPTQEYKGLIKRDSDGDPILNDDGTAQTTDLTLQPKYFVVTGIKNDESSGSAWSKACAIIYRPEEPDVPVGDDNPGAKSTQTADETIMYAGESAGLIWDGKAKSVNSLRIKAAQSIVALVPVDKEWTGKKIIEGTYWYKANEGGKKRDVCTYFSDKEKLEIPEKYSVARDGGCKQIELDEWDTESAEARKSSQQEYGHALSISVPDNVGYKVCNSMGWKYEHWVGLIKKTEKEKLAKKTESDLPASRVEWKHYEEDDYWTTYDAKCRTIAKKPSTAIWNGSLMTMGGVKTSLSPRIDFTDDMFGKNYDESSKKLYGSWTEYLGIVNGKYYGLGTGGSLWKSGLKGGSEVDKLCNMKNTLNGNTPLTVSNLQAGAANGFSNGLACNALGNALVSQDTVYLGRLKSFLLDQASKGRVKLITNGTISSNVDAISGGPLATMQQNVIYVPSDDLTITGDVTQINAWVVVPNGKIKTCDSWADKTTEAAVRSKNGTLYKTDNMKCQNQLVFNGPVYAGGGLELRRTYGSDALMPVDLPGVIPPSDSNGRNRSAEIFNLSADTYLWAFAQAQRYDSSFTDAYIRELAPRY